MPRLDNTCRTNLSVFSSFGQQIKRGHNHACAYWHNLCFNCSYSNHPVSKAGSSFWAAIQQYVLHKNMQWIFNIRWKSLQDFWASYVKILWCVCTLKNYHMSVIISKKCKYILKFWLNFYQNSWACIYRTDPFSSVQFNIFI